MGSGQQKDVTFAEAQPFVQAHARGEVETVRRLLAERPELESFPARCGTWLQQAAAEGHVALAEFWLARGVKVDVTDPAAAADCPADALPTALHVAKSPEMIRLLVARG